MATPEELAAEQAALAAKKEEEKKNLPEITQERFDEIYGVAKRSERKLKDQDVIIKTQHTINQKLAAKVEELLQNTSSSVSAGQLTDLRSAREEALRSDNFSLVNEIDDKIMDIKLAGKGSKETKGILAEIEEETAKATPKAADAWVDAESEFFEENPDFEVDKRKARLSQVIYGEVMAEEEWKNQSPKKILQEMKRRTEETLGGTGTSAGGGVSGVRGSSAAHGNDRLPDGLTEDTVVRMAQNLGLNATEFRKQIIASGGLK